VKCLLIVTCKLLLLYFNSIVYLSGGQAASEEMFQKHSMHSDNDIAIKEVIKLVALSELLQENFHEIQSSSNVSVIFTQWAVFIHYNSATWYNSYLALGKS